MINQLFRRIILILIILISIGEVLALEEKRTHLKDFNAIMLKLEDSVKKNKIRLICNESRKAIILIGNNMKDLKEEEPKYAWNEIKGLMEEISIQLCSRRTKK